MTLRFAACRLDLDARRLFRGTREIHLSPKAFELLKLLVERRPTALSKADLLAHVWPDVFVSDASLTKVVNQIREGVGDRARRPSIIRTVHGYGYGFAADAVEEASGQATARTPNRSICRLVCGSREFALPEGEHIVGRDPAVSLWLDSRKASRRHARVVVSGAVATIEDLGSKNGTFVRGGRIDARTVLTPGDRIDIGEFTFVFHGAEASGSTETESVAARRIARDRKGVERDPRRVSRATLPPADAEKVRRR